MFAVFPVHVFSTKPRLVIERISCIVSPGVACQRSVREFGTVGLPFTHYSVTDGLQGQYRLTK
jgi:hypothetical protein